MHNGINPVMKLNIFQNLPETKENYFFHSRAKIAGFDFYCICTSHSAYVATSTELHRVKIDGFLYPNFM